MEENHNPCTHFQEKRLQDVKCEYCLTEQRAICPHCYGLCVGHTHLCVNLPLTCKEYISFKLSQSCYIAKGTSFLKVKTNIPLRTAIENFCTASDLAPLQHRIIDPSGNLFDSSTLQSGYVYLLTET